MPSRSLTLAIVAFWLAVAGIFLVHDVWPRLAPSEPVLFPVDIVDEAGQQPETTSETISWLVFKNGGGGYRANVDWIYIRADDTFRSHCELERTVEEDEPARPAGADWLPPLHNVKGDSTYFLTRGGQMTRLEVITSYEFVTAGGPVPVTAKVSGAPRAGQIVPHLELSPKLPEGELKIGRLLLRDFERDAAAVPVLEHGIVLNPLHPPRRVPDLRPGQRWRVPVIDPLAIFGLVAPLGDALGQPGVPDAGAFVLDARVLPGAETVVWDGTNGNIMGKSETFTCRVVECTGDWPVTRLAFWAREGDGFLLKQEAQVWGDTWTFWRRPSGFQMQRYRLRQETGKSTEKSK